MRDIFRMILVFVAKLIAAILIGRWLFGVIEHLPMDMPDSVEEATRWVLHGIGRDDLANADDMEVIVGTAVALLTTAIGVVLVWGGHGLARRWARGGGRGGPA